MIKKIFWAFFLVLCTLGCAQSQDLGFGIQKTPGGGVACNTTPIVFNTAQTSTAQRLPTGCNHALIYAWGSGANGTAGSTGAGVAGAGGASGAGVLTTSQAINGATIYVTVGAGNGNVRTCAIWSLGACASNPACGALNTGSTSSQAVIADCATGVTTGVVGSSLVPSGGTKFNGSVGRPTGVGYGGSGGSAAPYLGTSSPIAGQEGGLSNNATFTGGGGGGGTSTGGVGGNASGTTGGAAGTGSGTGSVAGGVGGTGSTTGTAPTAGGNGSTGTEVASVAGGGSGGGGGGGEFFSTTGVGANGGSGGICGGGGGGGGSGTAGTGHGGTGGPGGAGCVVIVPST